MSIAVLENISLRERIVPISVAQYHRMNELGVISAKTELIEGVILEKMSKSPLHVYLIHLLHGFFVQHLSADYLVRKEDPLTLSHSEPEPDISIIKGQLVNFKTTHPVYAELVIEVAVSSLEIDRVKTNIYALANIPEYWIVIPTQQQIEVYSRPQHGEYRMVQIYKNAEKIETIASLVFDLSAIFSD
jgi:Uma2 family endonuclease